MSCNAKNCPAQIIKITDDLCEQWDCEWRKPKTNADRIRSMSDEELCKFMKGCPPNREQWQGCMSLNSCSPCWLDWLKQEAE